MYQINYYNGKPVIFNYCFQSLWAAVFKARAITESHGFPTEVMESTTGAIMVQFEPESQKAIYIDRNIPENVKLLARTPLE